MTLESWGLVLAGVFLGGTAIFLTMAAIMLFLAALNGGIQ